LINETFDYVKYLEVKKNIDDRSLNKAVWYEFSTWLKAKSHQSEGLKVLEIGAGIGTMIERLVEASLLNKCHYIALEPEYSFKVAAKNRLLSWAKNCAFNFKICSEDLWMVYGNTLDIKIEWLDAEAEKIAQLFNDESFDLILSHAVIDLLPVPEIMPGILNKLKTQGGFYFSLNFSGETEFYPNHESDVDIAKHYHADMDSRFPDLEWQPSRTGLELPKWLQHYGCKQIVEGESGWRLGSEDELIIKNILDTIKKALSGYPGLKNWLTERYSQLQQAQLEVKISNRDCFGLKQS